MAYQVYKYKIDVFFLISGFLLAAEVFGFHSGFRTSVGFQPSQSTVLPPLAFPFPSRSHIFESPLLCCLRPFMSSQAYGLHEAVDFHNGRWILSATQGSEAIHIVMISPSTSLLH